MGPTLHNDTCGIVTICKSFAFLYHYILLFILVKGFMGYIYINPYNKGGNIGHLKFFLRKNGPTPHNDFLSKIVTIKKHPEEYFIPGMLLYI